MPGLIGFVRNTDQEAAGELLVQMARALEPESRFVSELYHSENFGLGRISLKILNSEPQPVWNADQSLCAVMEGEIYESQAWRKSLLERGLALDESNDVEILLRLYETQGQDFVEHLNGAFVIAIWDGRANQLVIANDRLGLYPIYYSTHSGGFFFASGVRALLADPGLPRTVDRVAMAEFLTFDHVLRQRTLLEEVQLLPQATILTYGQGRLNLRQYWKPTFPETYPIFSEEDYVGECIHLLEQAVSRQSRDDLHAGLLLSGGLDSRALLALFVTTCSREDFATFTWGIPGSDEVRFAREASRASDVVNYFFELKPDWLIGLGEEGVRITDGLGNILNLHALAALEPVTDHTTVLFKGFMGDAMFGYGLRPRYWAEYGEEQLVDVHLEAYRDYDVLTFDLPEHEKLFTDSFHRELGNQIVDDYSAVIDDSGVRSLTHQRIYIDLTQRVPRMTINGVEVVRTRAAVRLPYCDNDLVDFALKVPPGLLIDRKLMVDAFCRAFPEFAQIPLTPNGLPLMACARDVAIRAKRFIQWHLRNRGLSRLAGSSGRPVKDYNLWLRTALRPWAESILLDPRCLDRGYFDKEFIQLLVEEHMAGQNHSVRLGALLTIEMWHRQFLD